jgi:hypothetical protein
LQQGVFETGFFFAGAECIGQPSASGVASLEAAITPSAQWFERKNQAASDNTTTVERAVIPMPASLRIVMMFAQIVRLAIGRSVCFNDFLQRLAWQDASRR